MLEVPQKCGQGLQRGACSALKRSNITSQTAGVLQLGVEQITLRKTVTFWYTSSSVGSPVYEYISLVPFRTF